MKLYSTVGLGIVCAISSAASIDTLSGWNGSDFAFYWVPSGQGSDHYVQSFMTPNSTDLVLKKVTFSVAVEQTVPWNSNYAPAPITGEVRVYQLNGTQVLGSALQTSAAFTVTQTNGQYNSIAVNLDATLQTGLTYGIDIVNLSGGVGRFGFRWNNPYSSGRALFADDATFPNLSTLGSVDGDIALRADFSPVPEPTMLTFAALSLAGIARRRRIAA